MARGEPHGKYIASKCEDTIKIMSSILYSVSGPWQRSWSDGKQRVLSSNNNIDNWQCRRIPDANLSRDLIIFVIIQNTCLWRQDLLIFLFNLWCWIAGNMIPFYLTWVCSSKSISFEINKRLLLRSRQRIKEMLLNSLFRKNLCTNPSDGSIVECRLEPWTRNSYCLTECVFMCVIPGGLILPNDPPAYLSITAQTHLNWKWSSPGRRENLI